MLLAVDLMFLQLGRTAPSTCKGCVWPIRSGSSPDIRTWSLGRPDRHPAEHAVPLYCK
jgi:hypothetical protein